MPRYFFDSDDGDRVYRDRQGITLPSVQAATEEAKRLVCDLVHGVPTAGRTILACVVRNEAGAVVYRLMMTVDGEVGIPLGSRLAS